MTCHCSRRDFLARGLYGIGIGAGMPLFLEPHVGGAHGAGAPGHERGEIPGAHPRGARALGRERRVEHCRAARRPRLLPRAAAHRHPREGGAQGQRHVRLPPVDGRVRTALQGRPHGRRPRLRLRPPQPVAFLVDELLAHGRAERRRATRLAGSRGRRSPQPRDAQSHRQHRNVAVARRPQRQALAARLRRPVALPARRHRRPEEGPGRAGRNHRGCVERDARLPLRDGAQRGRQLRFRPRRHRRPIGRPWTTASATRSAAGCSASPR